MKMEGLINKEFGKLFHHSEYQGDTQLLRQAIYELAEHLGHSFENPISLSVLCLQLMIPFDVCGAICIDITRLFNDGEIDKLKDYIYIKGVMVKHFPDAKDFTQLTIDAFMKGVARCWLPDLLPHLK